MKDIDQDHYAHQEIDSDAFPELEMNPDDYLSQLEHWDRPEKEKITFLRWWWDMLISMHELRIGEDSIHLILQDIFDKAGQDSGKLLEHKNTDNADKGD